MGQGGWGVYQTDRDSLLHYHILDEPTHTRVAEVVNLYPNDLVKTAQLSISNNDFLKAFCLYRN